MRGRPTRREAAVRAMSVLAAACAFVALAVLASPLPAAAHVPFVEPASAPGDGAPVAIPSPEVSRAVYGYLQPGVLVDRYEFSVESTTPVRIQLLVPVREDFAGFEPWLKLSRGRLVTLPAEEPFFEPFSLATFRVVRSVETTLRPGGPYRLAVNRGEGELDHGPYVIAFGGPEAFSRGDWVRTLGALPSIWMQTWSGTPVREQSVVWAAGIAMGFVVLSGLLVWWLLDRRARTRRAAETDADPAVGADVV